MYNKKRKLATIVCTCISEIRIFSCNSFYSYIELLIETYNISNYYNIIKFINCWQCSNIWTPMYTFFDKVILQYLKCMASSD